MSTAKNASTLLDGFRVLGVAIRREPWVFTLSTLGSVLFGALTVTGSFMAFGKLQEFLPGRPITYRGQNLVNLGAMLGAVALWAWLIVDPTASWAFWAMTVLAFVIGRRTQGARGGSFASPRPTTEVPVVPRTRRRPRPARP